ncbi:uncharacterized protein RCC_03765 [Ramularia collo-cygni]|uniref:Cell wall galactomannoprotein n=1 Tax=Ramularia collo-cygni TaxID=112498 RepID=A0A2D3UZT8_9PEZI|nr:uncharacterized protein RCC_03765 [Ramularia collo-cygni]CZT17927.1 uncharacterized protein RCC_03765 [Ramularia collo-cygni]
MRAFNLLLVAPLALASVVKRQSASATNEGITAISEAVEALTNAVNAYKGGAVEAGPVFNASLEVHRVNRAAKAAADASGRFSSEESKAIVDNVFSSVGVTIPISVKAIEAKKPLFDAAEITSLVKATIDLLQFDHRTFSLSTGAKLSLDQVASGLIGAGEIDAVLTGASLFYTL